MPSSEDQVRESFQRVRKDMDSIKEAVFQLKTEMINICKVLESFGSEMDALKQSQKQLQEQLKEIPAHPAQLAQDPTTPTHNPAQNSPIKPLKAQYSGISTGNGGVPTDRQTNQQTDRHMPETPENTYPGSLDLKTNAPDFSLFLSRKGKNPIEDAAKILDSLDSLKKEIRLKFKQLTDQELLVFSTLYQLEEEQGPVDYKALSEKLGLTESSIRDYIGRLLKKGIPVDKNKINNKQIQLSISQDLRKVASLSTILQLRDL